jgi:hypothetical protein
MTPQPAPPIESPSPAAQALYELTVTLSRTRRQRDSWCSVALAAIEALAAARCDLAMINGSLERRYARASAELEAAALAAYDGRPMLARRRPEHAA